MNELKAFLKSLGGEPARAVFAERCSTTLGHLRNVMYGLRPCAPELASEVELASGGEVRRWHLRPDDWHRIWPELVGTEGAPGKTTQEAA